MGNVDSFFKGIYNKICCRNGEEEEAGDDDDVLGVAKRVGLTAVDKFAPVVMDKIIEKNDKWSR